MIRPALALCALLAAAPLAAEEAAQPPLLRLSAAGEASAAPDAAQITIRAEATADSTVRAMAEAARRMQAVIGGLKALGIPAKNIATTDVSLYPRRIRDKAGRERVEQIAASAIRVRTEDFDLLGRMVDAATRAGATHVGSPDFVISDMDAVEDAARAAAVKRLAEKAALMACAAGMHLDGLRLLEEGGMNAPQPMPRMAMRLEAVADMAAPPVEAGTRDVTVTVSGVWALAEGAAEGCGG